MVVPMENDRAAGHFKIHNIGFYNLAPRQINCLCYNRNEYKLAVSRDDASIEIWDMRYAIYMEKCILGLPSSSVEGLGWLNKRLFSTGQTGELIEWNLNELKVKHKVSLTGNAAWCMDIDEVNSCIAVGTNEGYINTFAVDGDDLNFSKLFDKQEGAIICCKYDSSGKYLVTGSSDTIRIWNVASGHALYRMGTSRSEKNRETNVWSLVVLKDLTIIAGDSRGYITVWNGNNGTQIDSFKALDADVLTVAVNDDETMFCCSGVDPKIKIYVPVRKDAQDTRKWIRNLKRSVHDHDVKALIFIDETKIVSGGTDGFLNVSCSSKAVTQLSKNSCQYGPFLPQPCAVVATSSRLLLLKYFNYLEVWRLGRPNDTVQLSDEDDGQKKFLSLDENLKNLVTIRDRLPITCASISSNGMFLIYSTESTVKLYQLDTKPQMPSMTNVVVDSDKFTACAKVLFSSDSKSLYCVKSNGDIAIFSLSYNDEVDIKATISTKEVIKETISLVCLSKCERYLVCAGACGTLAIWKNNNNRWRHFKNLPNRDCAPTAMAIHNKSSRIVLAFSDYKIFEYDFTNDAVVCTTADDFVDNLPARFADTTNTAINNILLDENNENVVTLQNDSFLFVLEKDKTSSVHNALESRKKRRPEDSSNNVPSGYYKLKKSLGNYEHFVHLSWLSSSEIVAINVNPVTLIEQLPPSMKQKQFGIS